MATEIKAWQIVNGKLEPIETTMSGTGRKEEDLEDWIKEKPEILGQDILIIGKQVPTESGQSGRIDFLGIDKSGNLIIIELKRDMLSRDALAQAIDYASAIASWDVDKISEVCTNYTGRKLEDYLNEELMDVDLENLMINESQRILLVGFSVDESLQRMIEWLSNNYNVSINAVILKYIKTKNGEEVIARTVIIPEEIERERSEKRRIQMSDTPGNYNDDELRNLLKKYLSQESPVPRRIRDILLPLCLNNPDPVVTRDMIKKELVKKGEAVDEGKAGIILTTISRGIGIEARDYLRQIIQYDKLNPWEKENYKLSEKYKELVRNILLELNKQKGEEK